MAAPDPRTHRPETAATIPAPHGPGDAPGAVVLISQNLEEQSTDQVMRWLWHWKVPVRRINGDDLTDGPAFRFVMEPAGEGKVTVDTRVNGSPLGDAPVFWMRRWHTRDSIEPLIVSTAGDARLRHHLFQFYSREIAALREAVLVSMPGASRITDNEQLQVDKLRMLALAAGCGLRTPATLITNRRADLLEFVARHGRVITKPVAETELFMTGGHSYGLYTAELGAGEAAALPERFFPSAFQQKVEKAFEVRVFVLGDEHYAMALFSQGPDSTRTDFRRRGRDTFVRSVPYRLPDPVAASLRAFMDQARLTTGSVDLIRDGEGTHWFLEVNPVGQFGMTSTPCNYYLEKRVARRLAREAGHAAE